ncbi:hypothetical protein E0Z10_g4949 [Xylaria hypoxylon]|uniref:RRM domain-containing protein n=1 Tax=Xylaria hypoxylon TaxID=37992 RepID=A0A4Z0YHJ5_9PEZI|nr:hypothetical protein E0Z10_g4949 [Xylaria hypoxylon]
MMSNQGNRAGAMGRDLSGPWRTGIGAPAGTSQNDPPKTPNSSNYRGDMTNPRNKSADIPEAANCATWWTNLPPDCTYEMLFDSMRNVGAVSHAVINPPVGIHGTSAAKVEFFERASVDRLMAQSKNGHIRGHIRVGGRIPNITLNRIRVAAHSNVVPLDHGNNGRGSRVLRVIGDPYIIRQQYLDAVLSNPQNRVIYGLESARTSTLPDGLHCVEFRFASYTVQAGRARDVFMEQKRKGDICPMERALWEGVTCIFGQDPCE